MSDPPSPSCWSFDARVFGRELRGRRSALGMSTRELARRARVSQAYVVAVEGSRSSRDPYGPCPTVDVVTRLATALGTNPADLLASAWRSTGPHVLVVIEHDVDSPFDVLSAATDAVDLWVSAGHRRAAPGSLHVSLHDDEPTAYGRDTVEKALATGLAALTPAVDGQRLGLIFSESDSILLDATDTVLELEHGWCELTDRQVRAAGAQTAWNLCLYDLDVLRRMVDPVSTSQSLIASHDTVWTLDGRTLRRDRPAAKRLLELVGAPSN